MIISSCNRQKKDYRLKRIDFIVEWILGSRCIAKTTSSRGSYGRNGGDSVGQPASAANKSNRGRKMQSDWKRKKKTTGRRERGRHGYRATGGETVCRILQRNAIGGDIDLLWELPCAASSLGRLRDSSSKDQFSIFVVFHRPRRPVPLSLTL